MNVCVKDTNKYVLAPNLFSQCSNTGRNYPRFRIGPGVGKKEGIGSSLVYEKYSDENPPLDC
jgi:hypothetical protein